jgi:hypothetical protein
MKVRKLIRIKGWLPVIPLFLFHSACIGQSIRFSNFYDTNSGADAFLDIELTADERLAVVGRSLNLTDNPGRNDGIHVIVDLDGQTIAEHRYSFVGENFNTSAIMRSAYSNSLYSAGYYCVGDPGYCDFYFSKLNAVGDTLLISQISRQDTGDVLLNMVETRPNKIMLIGWTYDDTTDADADLLFITVDTLGNELNRVVYGGIGTDFTRPVTVADEDGDVLMTGFTRSFPSSSTGRTWVIRTDSIGNVEWHQTYSGIAGLNSGGGGITNLSDGNFVVAGSHVASSITKAYLMKIAPNGSMIWQKSIEIGDEGQSFWAVEELEDGTLVATGPTNVTSDGSQAGWLVKTDANGDTLWTRVYNPSNNTDYLRNMLVMPNGDIVMVGFGRGENSTTQDGWILRVDSMGCLEEGCWSVGIDDITIDDERPAIFPNPASDVVRFNVQSSKFNVVFIQAVDVLGRDCFSRSSFAMTDPLDVSGWPDGIYMITVTDEDGNRYAERLVVQH